MKKFLATLFAVTAFMFLMVPAFAAPVSIDLATEGADSVIGNSLNSMTAVGNKVLLDTWNQMYIWDIATDPQPLTVNFPPTDDKEENTNYTSVRPISDGEKVYCLSTQMGMLYPASLDGLTLDLAAPIELDFALMQYKEVYDGEEYDQTRQCYRIVLVGDYLYILAGGDDMNQYDMRSLVQFNISDGSCEELIKSEDILDLCGYKDGQLLILTIDRQAYYGGNDETPIEVKAFNCQSKAFEQTLVQLKDTSFHSVGGLAYDQASDAVMVVTPDGLLRSVSGTPFETAAYMTLSYYGNMQDAFVTQDGLYITANYEGVYARTTDPNDLPKNILKVAGASFYNETKKGLDEYNAAHPECPVIYNSDNYFFNAEKLYADMMSDSASDVYYVYSPGLIADFAKKGYCMDLSGSAQLKATMQRMYPCYQKFLGADSQIFGVPFETYGVHTLSYSPSVLAQIGLTEADLPKTVSQLADFMVDWVDEYGFDNPDLQLFEYANKMRMELISMAFNQQMMYLDFNDLPLSFDTPQMRETLNKIDSVSSIIKELDPEEEVNGYSISYGDKPTALFSNTNVFESNSYSERDYIPWAITLSEDIPMYYDSQVNCLFVNPNTKHKENAIAFLESVVQNLSGTTKVIIFPDFNEPVEEPYYAQNLAYYEKEYKLHLESIEKATDEEQKKLLEEKSATYDEWKKDLENNRYSITAEQIVSYRTIADRVAPQSNSTNVFYGSKNLQTLMGRYYVDQTITADQFITDVEKILKMMYLENQ